jgi:hypothetical protein
MADAIDLSSISPPSPPLQASKLPGWAAGMALGQLMGEGFIEAGGAWAEFVGDSEEMVEGVSTMFQNLMCQVMSSVGKSADYMKMDDDEDNPAKSLLMSS